MAKEHNIDRLLKLISMVLLKTVKVSFVAVFLENKNKECFEKLKKTKALSRAFKCEIPQEIYEKIGEKFE